MVFERSDVIPNTNTDWALILLGSFAIFVGAVMLTYLLVSWKSVKAIPPEDRPQIELVILSLFNISWGTSKHRSLLLAPIVPAIVGGVYFVVNSLNS